MYYFKKYTIKLACLLGIKGREKQTQNEIDRTSNEFKQ